MAELPAFDKLWNYADPAATEAAFRQILPQAEVSGNAEYLAQLLAQIARAQGLQNRFDEAHATLDRVEAMLSADVAVARMRCLLERGRILNSSGQPARAMPLFEQAWKLAECASLSRYAIDAVHMLAIAAAEPKEQVEWNLRGIAMVEADPSQRGWLFALYNNLGESQAKLGEHAAALECFETLARLDVEQGREPDKYVLKDQSRMLRALGRFDEAMAIIRPVHERLQSQGERDGWISEEYGECLLASGDADAARPHFAEALRLLQDDPWVRQHEPEKLKRLRRLIRGSLTTGDTESTEESNGGA